MVLMLCGQSSAWGKCNAVHDTQVSEHTDTSDYHKFASRSSTFCKKKNTTHFVFRSLKKKPLKSL